MRRSPVDASLYPRGCGPVQFYLWVDAYAQRFNVPSAKGVEVLPSDLHVLVRNKRSPRLQRWFERNALSQTFELTNEAPG